MRYLVVIAKGKKNYSAYSPDVLGCVTTGKDREEVERHMREALEFHLEGMLEDNDPLPVPHTSPNDPDIPHGPNYTPIYMDIQIPDFAA
ncbi:MAG TPA: type II toxin-antitoxin system HicB family antitoxin [Ktedonobacteraceae bacterium]|nr:type II toxin-antitoxin system HicB family antitoxin [Ktedonobacteraceae bacterium]